VVFSDNYEFRLKIAILFLLIFQNSLTMHHGLQKSEFFKGSFTNQSPIHALDIIGCYASLA